MVEFELPTGTTIILESTRLSIVLLISMIVATVLLIVGVAVSIEVLVIAGLGLIVVNLVGSEIEARRRGS